MAGPLVIIAGPTASGKTALSLFLAEQLGGEILCCDSLQVYRAMDIGTAKASADERKRVTHYGLDLSDPHKPFDVKQFSDYAMSVAGSTEKPLFCVGGSGFYLQTFYGPVCDTISISPVVREHVQNILCTNGLDGLLSELDRRCNGAEFTIDRQNPRRVARALERAMETGEPPAVSLERFRKRTGNFTGRRVFTIYIEPPTGCHEIAIRSRIAHMLSEGLVGETETLRTMGFERNPSAGNAVGYREVLEFLDDKLSRDALPERIFIRSRQLCRKQRSWFRHHLPTDIVACNGQNDWQRVLDAVGEFLANGEPR
ncbi:MAG: tRNA (adenosine(37)-N6)-dimethylallyltransferase MiaA [Puniceicoccales bacterium]|nr:tRNA (adenosine(37)-N6)-dimethylallyltransferase MiaA [Puniceicoccales bacterium]